MSKLPKEYQFIDLSDYGRPIAKIIANSLKNTTITPIHVTVGFVISGLLAILCILNHYYWAAAFFLVLKSILDAADGELARIKKPRQPAPACIHSAGAVGGSKRARCVFYITGG